LSVRLAGICADIGVEILPTTATVRAGQTTAGSTLQNILDDYGEGHVIQLLRTFTETENRRVRIDAFALYAISDIMVAYPAWADSGLRWFEVFDGINLADIQRQAKANRATVPQRYGVAALLHRELSAAFAEKKDVAPPKQSAIQRRLELAAAKVRIVERKIELGRQLAELRDATPNNRKFGQAVRRQFDIPDANDACEMARVARLYAARPEIYRAVGWHALKELASSATSESQRQNFEARILAGERVTGAEIIRARATIGVRTARPALT
jgi:hypothetical protein